MNGDGQRGLQEPLFGGSLEILGLYTQRDQDRKVIRNMEGWD